MSKKSYLQEQVYLPGLSSYDLFTDEEFDVYMKIVEAKNELDKLNSSKATKEEKMAWSVQKKESQALLTKLIFEHAGKPRTVRLKNVINYPKDAPYEFPAGATWRNLKFSRKISEFSSELTRAMGLGHMDYTFDHIVVKWKSLDVLRQIVMDGFYFPLLNSDGTVTNKHYHFFTASAGQLRRDKIQLVSDDMWEKIHERIECGLTWDEINRRGGVNVNKLMAYTGLPASSTDEWSDFDIDKCIVIKQFKGKVTDRMMYIKPDYTYSEEICTVEIDHTDGCGMMLPEVSEYNFMIRMPWFKGLLCSFDFLQFCKEKNVPAVIEDFWGLEHDLIKEDIKIIFTESMFKMAKFFDSWDAYKTAFKKCGAKCGIMNYEESEINNATLNYQFIQSLYDFTDDEIKEFTADEHKKIMNITKSKKHMLETLKAKENSDIPYKAALAIYPEMLWEGYTRTQLKETRKRMLLDAKSGKIRKDNKRLFAIPDLYAACEFWFQHIENPKGLLEAGTISAKPFWRYDKADVLRSPSLYVEHAIRKIVHDPEILRWFFTNGIYTSTHDLITRILQLDVDGDQLNVVVDELFVSVAERNIKEYDIIPLFYDANKASSEIVSYETLFNGLKRAHDYSSGGITSIGEISNMLTRLWNRDNPDRVAAAWLTMFNNLVIDAAKTGKISHYKDYPAIARRINKAIGGKNGRLPYWFQFSKNGRKEPAPGKKRRQYLSPNNSTMNRICSEFEDIGNINLHIADIPPFNWQMFLSEPCMGTGMEICDTFCLMDSINKTNIIEAVNVDYASEKETKAGYDLLASMIIEEMTEKYGPLENSYPYIVKHLFAGKAMDKESHKQMFWRVYGDIAIEKLRKNLSTYSVCPDCGMKIPEWAESHMCKEAKGFFYCDVCNKLYPRKNSRQCRCETCQEVYAKEKDNKRNKDNYARRKKEKTERIISLVSRFEKT